MGFGSLATYVILFTVGVGMATAMMFSFRDYFSATSTSLEIRQLINNNKMNARMEIVNINYSEGGLIDNLNWNSSNDFNLGIFDNTSTNNDLLFLFENNNTGIWYSNIIELEGPVNFTQMSVAGIESLADSVRVRIRTAEQRQTLTGSFLGPLGTSDENDYYTLNLNQDINDIHNGDSVFQVGVWINDSGSEDNSSIDSIEIEFEYQATLDVTIRNTGTMELDTNRLDFFLVDRRIERTSILEKSVVNEPGLPNPGIWDSQKDLFIRLSTSMITDDLLFTATNEYGFRSAKRIGIN